MVAVIRIICINGKIVICKISLYKTPYPLNKIVLIRVKMIAMVKNTAIKVNIPKIISLTLFLLFILLFLILTFKYLLKKNTNI